MRKLNQWLLVGLVTLFAGCEKPSGEEVADSPEPQKAVVETISTADASALLKEHPEVRVLDIRTPDEFSKGHIDGAINIDFLADGFDAGISELDKTTPYLIHCASGGRSGQSLSKFEEQGFETIYHLGAGFSGWEADGLPVSQ